MRVCISRFYVVYIAVIYNYVCKLSSSGKPNNTVFRSKKANRPRQNNQKSDKVTCYGKI